MAKDRLSDRSNENVNNTRSLCSLVLIHSPHPLVNPSLSCIIPLSSSITPSLFHSGLKTYLFNKSFPPDFFYIPDCLHDNGTGLDLSRSSVYIQFRILIFLFISCGRLSWLPVIFLLHVYVKYNYRIVSYRIGYVIFAIWRAVAYQPSLSAVKILLSVTVTLQYRIE